MIVAWATAGRRIPAGCACPKWPKLFDSYRPSETARLVDVGPECQRSVFPAASYPRYSSRLSASRIGAAAGPRPTTPTIPHLFFSDASTIRRVRRWNLTMDRLSQSKE